LQGAGDYLRQLEDIAQNGGSGDEWRGDRDCIEIVCW